MIDLKILRQDSTIIEKALEKRGANIDIVKEILAIDKILREKQVQSQGLSASRNKLAKEIGILKSKGENADSLLSEVSKSKEDEAKLVEETKHIETKLFSLLATIPNIPNEDLVVGKDESSNKQVKVFGEKPTFSFQPKEHYELGKNLDMMDFEGASMLSGSRFVVLKSDLSLLERALGQFMLDVHTMESGYIEHSLPVLVNSDTLYGTGQLPKFSEDLFKIENSDKWLIPTSEVTLTNLVKTKNLIEKDLPQRNTALSLCFRSEAGSAGRDTAGMLRQHQFYKVELVSIAHPDKSYEELERMTACAESILVKLGISYRVVELCTGDMGFSAAKTYDIEAWIPGQDTYREISSCSNCTDFQARRMGLKFKDANGKSHFVHTLNGSGLAVGRTLIAVMENYQNEDGSITIPEVLIPYMKGKTVIKKD